MTQIDQPLDEVEAADGSVVTLVIPATPRFVQVARLTVATLANYESFTFDEIDDLRIAIDELATALVKAAAADAELTLQFELGESSVTVDGVLSAALDGKLDGGLPELTARILEVVVDDYQLDGGSKPHFSFTKSHLPLDADS